MKLNKNNKQVPALAKKKKGIFDKTQLEFWLMLLLPLFYFVLYGYVPMYGAIIAFKDYKFSQGILGSEWVGFDNFRMFFTNKEFLRIVSNTIVMNVVIIATSMVSNIALAVLLYNLRSRTATKVYQTALITPVYMSWVLVSYMVFAFLSPTNGMLNKILESIGMEAIDWYTVPDAWRFILPLCNVWKGVGMGSILYYATLMGISPELFEAADIDGGGRWAKVRHIMLPELIPIVSIQLIMSVGGIFGGDFGLFYQVTRNVGALYRTTDIIPTYIFRMMQVKGDMSTSSAAGLLQSIIGAILILSANAIVRKIDPERSLF